MSAKHFIVIPFIAACAHTQVQPGRDVTAQYDLTPANGADASPLSEISVTDVPCASSLTATSAHCKFEVISDAEQAAFVREQERLASHPDVRCRNLGAALGQHLADVSIFDKAIVRYVGANTFYGAGYAYESQGKWYIGVARRLDELNARTIDDQLHTLRHEIAHTLGARETATRDGWSARDYASNCA